jgi:hypothetical protein
LDPKTSFKLTRKELQIAIYYKIKTAPNIENALRTTLLIDLQEENWYGLRAFIHNLWINMWIFTVIAWKTQIFNLLL